MIQLHELKPGMVIVPDSAIDYDLKTFGDWLGPVTAQPAYVIGVDQDFDDFVTVLVDGVIALMPKHYLAQNSEYIVLR